MVYMGVMVYRGGWSIGGMVYRGGGGGGGDGL